MRFIPVYTGNMILNQVWRYLEMVYPCVYREHILVSTKTLAPDGLSLCIQGTCAEKIRVEEDSRFIPVYTGNI